MDAAPYTPLSARRVGPAKGPDSKDRFVGKLSFTPHVSQHRHSNSAHKRSPDSSQAEPSTSSRYLAHPPQSSLYIADPQTLNAVTASAGPPASQQSAAPLTAGREVFPSSAASGTSRSLSPAQTASLPRGFVQLPSRLVLSTAQQSLASASTRAVASDFTDTTHASFPSQQPVALNADHRAQTLLNDQEGMADEANNTVYEPLNVALSLPQPSAPSPMDASSVQQLHFGPPETDARPQVKTSASSGAALPSQALQRLSRHKTARLTPDGRGGASGLRWRPMTPSIDSPEKQELGRRIFGGLPTSSPLSTKKGPVSNSPLQDLRASTPVAGAAQLDKLAESSHDSTTTTAADSLSHTEHQPLLVQLQQQTVQAAVVGGVPIEQVSASLLAPTPILAKPLKGPKAVKEAFARLHELSTAAAGPAKELEESISNHAADQASDSRLRLRNGSTALAPTPAPNAVQPWHTTNRQQQPGALPQHKVSQGTQGEKTPILAMLERLRVLQQEGTHLAGLLKL
ncbi:MAG: hypothetical protein FRX49_05225 [Trebouxia sp. A1-2]|nr:MAG: hypothetical protein FRX49_05225 [Trebouxia sp. A1-2]